MTGRCCDVLKAECCCLIAEIAAVDGCCYFHAPETATLGDDSALKVASSERYATRMAGLLTMLKAFFKKASDFLLKVFGFNPTESASEARTHGEGGNDAKSVVSAHSVAAVPKNIEEEASNITDENVSNTTLDGVAHVETSSMTELTDENQSNGEGEVMSHVLDVPATGEPQDNVAAVDTVYGSSGGGLAKAMVFGRVLLAGCFCVAIKAIVIRKRG